MKFLIAGSRGFPHMDWVRAYVRTIPERSVVVAGGGGPNDHRKFETQQRDVDWVAIDEACICGMDYEVYPPDWKQFGWRAGKLRSTEMVRYVDTVIAFWDGESPGTRWTIRQALLQKKCLTLIRTDRRPGSSEKPTSILKEVQVDVVIPTEPALDIPSGNHGEF